MITSNATLKAEKSQLFKVHTCAKYFEKPNCCVTVRKREKEREREREREREGERESESVFIVTTMRQ